MRAVAICWSSRAVKDARLGSAVSASCRAEIADVTFSLAPRLQVADGDRLMRLAAEIDRPQQQLHRRDVAAGAAQICFDRDIGLRQQPVARCGVRQPCGDVGSDHVVGARAGKRREAVVDRNDGCPIAHHQPFDRGVRQPLHPIRFEFDPATLAQVDRNRGQREQDDEEAAQGHRDGEPGGRQGRLR